MIRKYEIISASGPPVRRDSSDGLFSPPRSSIWSLLAATNREFQQRIMQRTDSIYHITYRAIICPYVNIYFNLPLTSISVFIQRRTRTADVTKRKQQLDTTMKSNNGYAVSKCRALFFLIAFAG